MADPAPPGHCQRCLLRADDCLCAAIPRIETRTHVAILRHVLERKRASNTGRLAALALVNSSLHTYGDRDQPLGEAALVGGGACVLVPDAAPLDPANPPARLIVLDGSWQQARHMRQRLAYLHHLPTAGLPPAGPRRRMRTPPKEGAMATLEAIAVALGILEDAAVADRLLALYDLATERLNLRSRRPGGAP